MALATLLVLCFRPVRRLSYELFLRSHQTLSIVALLAVWNHVRDSTTLVRHYSTGIIGVFVFGGLGQVFQVLLLNRFFLNGFPRARISRIEHAVCLVVDTPTPLSIRPGQYINVCLPGVSFRSVLQSHPFYVCFARHHGGGTRLEMMIEPQRGWTSKLLLCARTNHTAEDEIASSELYATLFTGPHGWPICLDDYGTIVLIASGWGLMAQMPYLQALIHGCREGTVKAQRLHLIWQLNTIGT